jgi:ABC-type sugar transport system substrate-binding protein
MKKILILSVMVSEILFAFCPSSTFALGAIAVANNQGKGQPVFAVVIGYNSDEDASKAALDQCASNGATNCTVVLNFERCGSIATSATSYGVGYGVTGRFARNMSLRNCGDDCSVAENKCEDY